MSGIISAILLAASSVVSAPEYQDYAEYTQYTDVKNDNGLADKVLSAFAGAAAAVAVYRLSDDTIEYFPLQGQINANGASFRETLSMKRGGFRFQLSPIGQSRDRVLNAAPDFRRESRNMAHAMPGYPQPARFVVGLKINY